MTTTLTPELLLNYKADHKLSYDGLAKACGLADFYSLGASTMRLHRFMTGKVERLDPAVEHIILTRLGLLKGKRRGR